MRAPVDSALASGQLMLPTSGITGPLETAIDPMAIVSSVLIGLCLLFAILTLRNIVNVLPSIFGCAFRWKENLILEDSMRLNTDRNIVAVLLLAPYCLLAAGLRLYSPSFTEGMEGLSYAATVAGILLSYLLLRFVASRFFKPSRKTRKVYEVAAKSAWTFFCLTALLSLTVSGICSFSDVSSETARTVVLYVNLFTYLLFLFRKTQILMNNCSFITAFLYLCGLEILPTSLLVASAVIL